MSQYISQRLEYSPFAAVSIRQKNSIASSICFFSKLGTFGVSLVIFGFSVTDEHLKQDILLDQIDREYISAYKRVAQLHKTTML